MNEYNQSITSVHDPLLVHVLQSAAKLNKILPNRSFWNKFPLLLEVFDHSGNIFVTNEMK